jgi:hypothetical protein
VRREVYIPNACDLLHMHKLCVVFMWSFEQGNIVWPLWSLNPRSGASHSDITDYIRDHVYTGRRVAAGNDGQNMLTLLGILRKERASMWRSTVVVVVLEKEGKPCNIGQRFSGNVPIGREEKDARSRCAASVSFIPLIRTSQIPCVSSVVIASSRRQHVEGVISF